MIPDKLSRNIYRNVVNRLLIVQYLVNLLDILCQFRFRALENLEVSTHAEVT